MTLMLSAAPSRGLSGEGRLLDGLAAPREEAAGRIRAALRWQGRVDVDEISRLAAIDRSTCHVGAADARDAGTRRLRPGRVRVLPSRAPVPSPARRGRPAPTEGGPQARCERRASRRCRARRHRRPAARRGRRHAQGASRGGRRALHLRLAQQARRRSRALQAHPRGASRPGRRRLSGLDLTALAGSRDADAAMNALLGLDERSRRALAPDALELHRAARRRRMEQLDAAGGQRERLPLARHPM